MNRFVAFVLKEAREMLPATIFFLLLLHLIALTKAVSLGDFNAAALRATTATVGALIIAKAILVVEALAVSRRFADTLAVHVLWKALLFSVVALLFRFLEEAIELAAKHGGLRGASRFLIEEVSWPLFAVLTVWLVAGLLLYALTAEVVRAVGAARVKQILLGSGGK